MGLDEPSVLSYLRVLDEEGLGFSLITGTHSWPVSKGSDLDTLRWFCTTWRQTVHRTALCMTDAALAVITAIDDSMPVDAG